MTTVFTAALGTETNTFSSLPTGFAMFAETCLFRQGGYGAAPPAFAVPLAVWRRLAEDDGWRVVESLCAFAMPAGKTVRAVYEGFRDEILADLAAALPVDAVLLALHGAMVADGYDDAEGDLLEHVRRLVGPAVPVGVVLDPHGNVGRRKLDNVTALVLFKEYPHTDMAERAAELFAIVAGAIAGRVRPVIGWFDCRTVGVFHTTRQPMRGFVDRCAALEGRDGVLSVSIVHGFPWADVVDMGSKIVVIVDGDRTKAERLAGALGMEFYRLRHATQPHYASLDQAMARAAAHGGAKPLVLADVSDNAGGGAASDSTYLLGAMLDRRIGGGAIAMIWDPMAVRIAGDAGIGAALDIRIGGKLGALSGPPLDLRVRVTGLAHDAVAACGSDNAVEPVGDMAAFDAGGVAIVCNSLRTQCRSLDCFTNVGIDPSSRRVLAVKSMQNFHAAFAPIAAEILYVAASGAVAPDFLAMRYEKAARGQWPFVADPLGRIGAP